MIRPSEVAAKAMAASNALSSEELGTAPNAHAPAEAAALRPRTSMTEHATFLILASLVMTAAVLLGLSGNGTEKARVMMPFLNVPVPSLCQFKNITGIDCPGCGLTRAFIRITRGDFASAWWLNPGSFVMFAFIGVQIPYRAAQLWRMSRGKEQIYWPTINRWVVIIVAVTLIGQWLWKLSSTIIHFA